MLVDEPPGHTRDGGMIRAGADPELDRQHGLRDGGREAQGVVGAHRGRGRGVGARARAGRAEPVSLTRPLIVVALVAAPAVARAQFVDRSVVVPPPAEDAARPDDARPPRTASRPSPGCRVGRIESSTTRNRRTSRPIFGSPSPWLRPMVKG